MFELFSTGPTLGMMLCVIVLIWQAPETSLFNRSKHFGCATDKWAAFFALLLVVEVIIYALIA